MNPHKIRKNAQKRAVAKLSFCNSPFLLLRLHLVVYSAIVVLRGDHIMNICLTEHKIELKNNDEHMISARVRCLWLVSECG
jgi:hypothetical protein